MLALSVLFSVIILLDIELYLFSLVRSFSFQISLLIMLFAIVSLYNSKLVSFIHFTLSAFSLIFILVRSNDALFKANLVYAAKNSGNTIKIFHANVFIDNKQTESLFSEIEKNDVDIFTVVEASRLVTNRLLKKYDSSYSYKIYTENFADYNILLFSRIPLYTTKVKMLPGTDSIPYIEARLMLGRTEVSLLVLHLCPPMSVMAWKERNAQLEYISDVCGQEKSPVVIIGDFNCVPWDIEMRKFKKKSGVVDFRKGLSPSFPADNFIAKIPIDYILTSPDINCNSFKTVCIKGSDHSGVVGKYSFNTPAN